MKEPTGFWVEGSNSKCISALTPLIGVVFNNNFEEKKKNVTTRLAVYEPTTQTPKKLSRFLQTACIISVDVKYCKGYTRWGDEDFKKPRLIITQITQYTQYYTKPSAWNNLPENTTKNCTKSVLFIILWKDPHYMFSAKSFCKVLCTTVQKTKVCTPTQL